MNPPSIMATTPEANSIVGDVFLVAHQSNDFRNVLHTTKRTQLVVMHLRQREELKSEVHAEADQIFVFVSGSGFVTIGQRMRYVRTGHVAVVAAGTRHAIQASDNSSLRFFTIYSPPQHAPGTRQATMADEKNEKKY